MTEYISYTIKKGDNYKKIARSFYQDGSLWPNIKHANPSLNPNSLPVGRTIKIPQPPDGNLRDGGNSTK